MQQSRKILFLTAPIGSGHTRAAQAIKAELDRKYPATQSQIVNLFDFFHPFIGETILKSYIKILNIFPTLYGKMYDWGNESPAALQGREWISRYLATKMKEFIADYRPDGIVCTHASPAGLAAYLRSRNMIDIPVFGVVTDFVIHRLWIYKELENYYVAHHLLKDQMESHGVSRKKSLVTGIPVDYKFTISYQRNVLLGQMNLKKDLPIILIMGGGSGLLPMDDVIAVIEKRFAGRAQIVAVTGQNQRLYNRLTKLYLTNDHIRVVGFVTTVPEFMALSAVMITKPGGMTAAEALSSGLPMIIYKPLPGQEEGNADYLISQKVAQIANTTEDLLLALTPYIEGEQVQQQKEMVLRLSKPNAAADIVKHLVNFLDNGQTNS